MPYPIYLDGEEAGVLTEHREGLYRVFRADCAPREGLCRLWLHGGGRSVYLGLLSPQDGRLRLTARFSRAAGLPERIDCAQNSPSPPRPRPAPPEGGCRWQARPDGSLLAVEDGRRLLALPAALSPASPLAGRLRRIAGKDYLVFRF